MLIQSRASKQSVQIDSLGKNRSCLYSFYILSWNRYRVRNPWGNDVEWKGAWSDGSREWSRLSQDELDELEYQAAKDGEFWYVISSLSFKKYLILFH